MAEINTIANPAIARTLPANIQAEQMLLGAILINSELLYQINEFLRTEHFFEQLHQKIYDAIEKVIDKGLAATPVVIKSMLEHDLLFQEVKGLEYLHKLTTIAMLVINPKDYGQLVYELALKRSLITIGEEVVNTAYDSNLQYSAAEQIEKAEGNLYNLASEGISKRSFVKGAIPAAQVLESIELANKSQDQVIGLSTGFLDLDNKLLGFHNSDLVIIAARPSMGKTAFAINLALNTAKILQVKHQDKDPDYIPAVGFLSLEMSSEQIVRRILSIYTGIDSTALRSGKINEENYNKIRSATVSFLEDCVTWGNG
jgi:replicative DNA helicase